MTQIIINNLCDSCKYFDVGNCECVKGYYLDWQKVTVECEDFKCGEYKEEND